MFDCEHYGCHRWCLCSRKVKFPGLVIGLGVVGGVSWHVDIIYEKLPSAHYVGEDFCYSGGLGLTQFGAEYWMPCQIYVIRQPLL